MKKYTWSQQAVEELKARLPKTRTAPGLGNDISKKPPSGGKTQVKRGTPQNTHPGNGVDTETYNLDGGGTQTDVVNATTVEALTTNSYWLFLIGSQWHSFPAQLDLCNPTNPIQ